jgi:hypothetical protein
MAQQTAVDYLIERFLSGDENIMHVMIKAKLMEKEQIKKSFISGGYDGLHFPKVREAFDRKYLEDKFFEYFNETYG